MRWRYVFRWTDKQGRRHQETHYSTGRREIDAFQKLTDGPIGPRHPAVTANNAGRASSLLVLPAATTQRKAATDPFTEAIQNTIKTGKPLTLDVPAENVVFVKKGRR